MLFDIDDNGSAGAFSDAILILRYMVGLKGMALIDGAVSLDAVRETAADIEAYLGQVIDRFDIDDNGTLGAFSDGILIARYLTGLRGEALISGAVGPNANRTGAEEIEAYLEELANQTANPPSLFTTIAPDALPDQLPNTNDPSIIRQEFVAVDFNPLVAADSREGSQTLDLNLFEDASFDVIFDSAELSSDNSSLVRVGTVEGEADSEVYLVNSTADNIATGNIRVGDKSYQIRFVGEGIHAVREIDQTVFVDEPEIEPDFEPDTPVAIADGSSTVDDGSIIDVMVVYSPAARQAAGGTAAMNQLIVLAEEETNKGYENSGVIQRIRIVHSEEVSYTETSTDAFGNALDALTNGQIDNVHALRNIHSADMVSLWIEDDQYCGLAWVMREGSYSFEDRAFSVVGQNCATGYYSFGHELGHNQGVTHNREDAGGQASFPYAYGYRDPDREFRTIMAYNGPGGYTRINRWSNPDLTTDSGKPLGIPGEADNRLALNNNRIFAANWRHSNDNFANAKVINGSEITETALNVNATEETSEQNHAGNSGGKSVWWSWTAPSNGIVTMSTAGSDFNTLLGVYTGNSLSNLTEIASNDDVSSSVRTSSVTFSAVAGTDYKIAVDGFGGAIGNITLNLNFEQNVSVNPPNNDNFANAEEISGADLTSTGLNVDATKEFGEQNHAGNSGGTSVWWSWTAPSNGSVTMSTAGSDFDTLLGVYTGNSLSSLTEIASNDDVSSSVRTSSVTFSAVAGTDYKIAVDGFGGAIGNITLNIESNNPPIAVDDFASTDQNSSVNIFVLDNDFDEDGVLTIQGIPAFTGFGGSVSIIGDALVYSPADGFAGTDSFNYTISDGNGTSSATVSVTVEDLVNPPNNDNFANAQEISGADLTSTGLNVDATKEVGEQNHAENSGGTSVWWSWTAPSNGSVTMSTAGSDFDTLLGVYTGNSLSSLTEIASNDDVSSSVRTSSVTFSAVAGTDYKIAVDGFGGAIGNITLNIESAGVSNNPPSAVNDAATTQENSSVTIAVLDNDFDIDGDAIAIAGVSTPVAGTISIEGDALVYSPALGFAGTDSFSYTIADGQLTDTATVTVTVEGTNPAPIAFDDFAFTQVNSSVTIAVLDNDLLDGSVGLSNFDSSSVVGGTIVRDNNDSPFNEADDRLIYTPASGFVGVDSFNYTISDGSGTSTATVSVIVEDAVDALNNDNFANAQEISGVPITLTGQNVNATREVGEPNHAGNAGGSSVWWSWTAPSNGSVTISTAGSDFDTVLGVYTGNSLSSLTEIASNDDSEGELTSSVTFSAVAGSDYKIAVDGFLGDAGNITLSIESASTLSFSSSKNIDLPDKLIGMSASDMLVGTKQEDIPSDGSEGFVEMSNSFTTETNNLLEFSDPNSLTVLGTAGNAVNANLPGFSTNSADGFTTYTDGTSSLVVDDNVIQNVLT